MSLILDYSLGQPFCSGLEKLNLARGWALMAHKTKGDIFQREINVYITTPEESLHLVKPEGLWHLPASAFISSSLTLLVLANSCYPCCIVF